MTTVITGKLWNADGTVANGTACVSWVAFQSHGVTIVGGQKVVAIIEGDFAVDLYPNITAFPKGMYYTVRMELDSGSVYEEYWIVPDLPAATIEQVRSTFPLEPGMAINPSQISGSGAEPGMILSWNGSYWEGGYVKIDNISPNWIRLNTGTAGSDVHVAGSPVSLGQEMTLNVPSASPTARGVVTIGDQVFGGTKYIPSVVAGSVPAMTYTNYREGQLQIIGNSALNPPGNAFIQATAFGGAALLVLQHAGGTEAAPTPPIAGAQLGLIAMRGFAGSGFTTRRVGILGITSDNWTATAQGAYLMFETTAPGTTASAERVRINETGLVSQGMVESKAGGIKFPDGTIQTTAGLTNAVAAQTPWKQNIDAAGFSLDNAAVVNTDRLILRDRGGVDPAFTSVIEGWDKNLFIKAEGIPGTEIGLFSSGSSTVYVNGNERLRVTDTVVQSQVLIESKSGGFKFPDGSIQTKAQAQTPWTQHVDAAGFSLNNARTLHIKELAGDEASLYMSYDSNSFYKWAFGASGSSAAKDFVIHRFDAAGNHAGIAFRIDGGTGKVEFADLQVNGNVTVTSAITSSPMHCASNEVSGAGYGLEIREALRGGTQTGNFTEAPRLRFLWAGRFLNSLGMDSSGAIRTFESTTNNYAPFAAAQIESKSGGFKFPDGTVQITAATGGPGGAQTPWTQDINAAGFNLNNLKRIGINQAAETNNQITIQMSSDAAWGMTVYQPAVRETGYLAMNSAFAQVQVKIAAADAVVARRNHGCIAVTNDLLIESVAGVERLRVSATGTTVASRVLINRTTSTGENLQVQGNALITDWLFSPNLLMGGPEITQPQTFMVANDVANVSTTGSAFTLREVGYVGTTQNAIQYSPRLAFSWKNNKAVQLGMDYAGILRTFDSAGTAHVAFQAALIESKSGGFKFPDASIQTTAALTKAAYQTPWTQNIDGGQFALSNTSKITIRKDVVTGLGPELVLQQFGGDLREQMRIGFLGGASWRNTIVQSLEAGATGQLDFYCGVNANPDLLTKVFVINTAGVHSYGNVGGVTFNGMAIQGRSVIPGADQIMRSSESGYLYAGYINTNIAAENLMDVVYVYASTSSDNFIRKCSKAWFASQLPVPWTQPNFPAVQLYQTAGPLDQKRWQMHCQTETLYFSAVNDPGNAATNWLEVYRTGYTVTGGLFRIPLTIAAGLQLGPAGGGEGGEMGWQDVNGAYNWIADVDSANILRIRRAGTVHLSFLTTGDARNGRLRIGDANFAGTYPNDAAVTGILQKGDLYVDANGWVHAKL